MGAPAQCGRVYAEALVETSVSKCPRCLKVKTRPEIATLRGLWQSESNFSRFINPTLPQYGLAIPAHNGDNQVLSASYERGVKSNGTGPASRQLRDKSGGVASAGFFS